MAPKTKAAVAEVAKAITYSSSPDREDVSNEGKKKSSNSNTTDLTSSSNGSRAAAAEALLDKAAASTTASPRAPRNAKQQQQRAAASSSLTQQQQDILAKAVPNLAINPFPSRIAIHGAKGILFDTMPNSKFYTTATFGRGALLMSQRRLREEDVSTSSSSDDDDNTAANNGKGKRSSALAKKRKRRVYEKPKLLLPDADGGVYVQDGHTYHVVTLAVNPRAMVGATSAASHYTMSGETLFNLSNTTGGGGNNESGKGRRGAGQDRTQTLSALKAEEEDGEEDGDEATDGSHLIGVAQLKQEPVESSDEGET